MFVRQPLSYEQIEPAVLVNLGPQEGDSLFEVKHQTVAAFLTKLVGPPAAAADKLHLPRQRVHGVADLDAVVDVLDSHSFVVDKRYCAS